MKIVTFFVSVLVGTTFSGLQVWFTQVLISLCHKPKLIQQFRCLLSILQISRHTDGQERRLEKNRMKSINLCQCLNKNENIWNLAIIDNIDSKKQLLDMKTFLTQHVSVYILHLEWFFNTKCLLTYVKM